MGAQGNSRGVLTVSDFLRTTKGLFCLELFPPKVCRCDVPIQGMERSTQGVEARAMDKLYLVVANVAEVVVFAVAAAAMILASTVLL